MYEHELKQRIPDVELMLKLEPEELAGVLLPILRKEGADYQGKISGYSFCNRMSVLGFDSHIGGKVIRLR